MPNTTTVKRKMPENRHSKAYKYTIYVKFMDIYVVVWQIPPNRASLSNRRVYIVTLSCDSVSSHIPQIRSTSGWGVCE